MQSEAWKTPCRSLLCSRPCKIPDTSKVIAEKFTPIILASLKIGLLQLNSTIGDFAANRQKLVAAYEKACALGAEFILAPELFLCGYPPRDLLLRADFIDANLAALEETAKSVGAVPLCVGLR